MSIQFTADSIFEIGVQIEKNGKSLTDKEKDKTQMKRISLYLPN